MHPYSAGLIRLDRARETEGTDGLKASRRGKSEQLSCVTKASTPLFGAAWESPTANAEEK